MSETSATFEASEVRVNIDSAKKAPPIATPDPADQLFVLPGFNRMGVPEFM